MSEEALNRFLERLRSDEALQQKVKDDLPAVVEEFGLSGPEVVAFDSGDDDALRRLAGIEVEAFDGGWYVPSYGCFYVTLYCGSTARCGTVADKSTHCCGGYARTLRC
jgi:hypothetical protein